MSMMTVEPLPPIVPRSEEIPLRMSYEEFLDWLDEDKHAEWVNGEVIMHSPVSRRHSDLNGFLSAVIRLFVRKSNLGEVHCDPFQMKIEADLPSRAPDILFVATENKGRLKANILEGPADLVIEIVRPGRVSDFRGDKFFEYEAGGVREYWFLDPEQRTAEFHVLGANGRYTLAALDTEGRFHSVVLADFWLQVDWLWQDTLPTLREVLRAWEK